MISVLYGMCGYMCFMCMILIQLHLCLSLVVNLVSKLCGTHCKYAWNSRTFKSVATGSCQST